MKSAIVTLQTQDPIWRPYAFDRVEVSGRTAGGEKIHLGILGRCWSEYPSGPSQIMLANVAGDMFGEGFYGLHRNEDGAMACRSLGFRPA